MTLPSTRAYRSGPTLRKKPSARRRRPSIEPLEDRTLLSTPRISEFAVPVVASTISGIVAGPDNNLWFTEPDPVAGNKIGRITPGGTLSEFVTRDHARRVE